MRQFLIGVLVSSIVWIGVLYAQSQGVLTVFAKPTDTEQPDTDTGVAIVDTDFGPPKPEKRVRKKRRGRNAGRRQPPIADDLGYETGDGQVGDDLNAGERAVSMNGGGESQLSNGEIEAAIDRRFNGIERCLTLMPPDAPTTGKLVLGINISGSGSVTRVNLSGPNAMIKGESGACFRRIVSGMKFRSFNGPDMIVHYPITFE